MPKEVFDGFTIYTEPSPRRKRVNRFILLIGAVSLFALLLAGSFNSKPGNQDSKITVASASPPEVAISRHSDECDTIRADITMLRTSFSVGEDSPQEVSFLLEAARNDFNSAASSFSGSKSDWLHKMAELSGKISSYILSGVPEDGPRALDQLFANMNLVDQFCN